MTEISAGELQRRTGDVLRRVESGERITITSDGRPIAELTPVRTAVRRPISRDELTRRLNATQADPGLRDELAGLDGNETSAPRPID